MADKQRRDLPGVRVAPGVLSLRTLIANVVFVREPGSHSGDWILVDTGVGNSGKQIRAVAEELFGKASRPQAIVLTHGHFDHVGSVKELAEHWDVPVYAHPLELPFLTGEADYPPPDPSVGGGLMARISPLYPREGIDLGDRVHPLPADGSVPGAPGWRWIHTPGHTPGHVSLFRESDKVLIAGDAFTTVKQESALAVMLQEKGVHGPPAYFTTDWEAAEASVEWLDALEPSAVVTGHGLPMKGEALHEQLEELAHHFESVGMPKHGRYLPEHHQAEQPRA